MNRYESLSETAKSAIVYGIVFIVCLASGIGLVSATRGLMDSKRYCESQLGKGYTELVKTHGTPMRKYEVVGWKCRVGSDDVILEATLVDGVCVSARLPVD